MEEWRDTELKSYGVLVKNFHELDSQYTHQYEKIMGRTVFYIGPAALIHQTGGEKMERGHKTVVGETLLVKKKLHYIFFYIFWASRFEKMSS